MRLSACFCNLKNSSIDDIRNSRQSIKQNNCAFSICLQIFFYLSIYPPDSKESDGGTNTQGKQLP